MARVKKEPDARREQILAATLELITERGINGVRASDVAGRLSVSPGLVFYHFDTLEKLIVSAFRSATERDLAKLETLLTTRDGTMTERLHVALQEYGPTGAAPSWQLWIEGWSASLRNPELRAVIRTLDNRWRAVITDLVALGVASGEFTTSDPRGVAWRLTAMLDGLAVQRVAFDEAISGTDVANWTRSAIASELGVKP
ncbi:TetR family transcriptional regulator [Nocardia sp. SYP-A9097]|uniref:TetR/AcrR family transcriptional regulator n=1 Tax=Nocardia sp. SYP-A9097 TaxID=2663237 RepID=UPI00129B8BE5|nr:TetR family transcriptional regulator C-terminal domain-containing protein [Nocardia sp. SYP-A9097]MRH93455.1 TetR family transcriptional regulator [Nocardia sp. SYP-A9097]